jgi:hypothetical protein
MADNPDGQQGRGRTGTARGDRGGRSGRGGSQGSSNANNQGPRDSSYGSYGSPESQRGGRGASRGARRGNRGDSYGPPGGGRGTSQGPPRGGRGQSTHNNGPASGANGQGLGFNNSNRGYQNNFGGRDPGVGNANNSGMHSHFNPTTPSFVPTAGGTNQQSYHGAGRGMPVGGAVQTAQSSKSCCSLQYSDADDSASMLQEQLASGVNRSPCIWCGDRLHALVDCYRPSPQYSTRLCDDVLRQASIQQASAFNAELQFQHVPEQPAPIMTSRQRPVRDNPHDSSRTLPRGGFRRSRVRGGFRPHGNPPQDAGTAGQERPPPNSLTQTSFDRTRLPTYTEPSTNSVLHYPLEDTVGDDGLKSTGSGEPWALSKDIQSRIEERKNANPIGASKYPLRTGFTDLTGPKTAQILTNHFNYEISPGRLWEYKITGLNETRRDKVKRIFVKAIEQWPFLQINKAKFASNYFDSIVSWKNLHEDITTKPVTRAGETLDMWDQDDSDGDKTLKLRFNLDQSLDLTELTGYTQSKPDREKTNFEKFARCLNMIVSKTLDKSIIHQQSANKFFVKNARAVLKFSTKNRCDIVAPSHTLEIIRGYFYNVKPGMGNLILNFSLATSAFFRPILVSELLADTETFEEESRRLDVLRGLRVYVVTERKKVLGEDHDRLNSENARIKKVTGLGGDIETLTFRKKIRGTDGKFQRDAPEVSQKKMKIHWSHNISKIVSPSHTANRLHNSNKI